MARKPSRKAWRRAWVEASKDWSLEARAIAASAPLEEVAPGVLALARAGRLHPPEESDDDYVDRLFARAREIDAEAWAEHDRLEAERGVNPDLLGQRPRSQAERCMRDRRSHSVALASDEALCAGDAAIAAVLAELEHRTRH